MIKLFQVRMEDSAVKRAQEVLQSGFIGQGKIVDEFEERLKEYFNHPYVVTTNSATSALHLVFHMLKKEWGDSKVLCSPLTCTASNWPVLLNNYDIEWVDVDNTLNMDIKGDLQGKLDGNTGLVYIVHWGGYPINYNLLCCLLDQHKRLHGYRPVVVEDCAHAMGTSFTKEDYVAPGNFSDILKSYKVYSFQAIKAVTSIDGGCLLCPDEESYKRAKLLRWYGIDRETNRKDFRCEADIPEIGFKFHMNDVCAAVGIENLKEFPKHLERNKFCAAYYEENIESELVETIPYDNNCSYWLYTIFVDRQQKFMDYMKEKGIMVSRVHERNDIHSCVKQYKTELPNLDKLVKKMVCIPCGHWVTYENLKYIVRCIDEGW